MAKIYYRLIIKEDATITIDDVPDRWRDQVLALLNAN